MLDRYSGLHPVQSELSKIQKWKVATQMDLDAKETKVRHAEALLQQLGYQLRKEQRHSSHLQDKYEAKCRESHQMQEQLRYEASVYQILEDGIRKLDGKLTQQENFIVLVKDLNEQKRREMLSLNARLEEVMSKLEKLDQARIACHEENVTLKQDMASLKVDLMNTLNRLSEQANQCEALQKALEGTNKDLNDSMGKIKNLEDTIDCKDRDIDIIKDNHLKEVNNLLVEAKSLESDLSVSEKRKEELNASLLQLSKDREQLAGDFKDELFTAETIYDELVEHNMTLENSLAHLNNDLVEKENAISFIQKEKQDVEATTSAKISKLEVELEEQSAAFKTLVEDKDIIEKQNLNLEKDLSNIKKVHNELKLLKIDYERAIHDVHDRDAEIHKLRQIQVQKLDQDEEMVKLQTESRVAEETMSKLCDEKASLESKLIDKDTEIKRITSLLQEKEGDLEKFRGESLDLARDVEKHYRQKLDEVEKEKSVVGEDLKTVKTAMEQMQANLDLKMSELDSSLSEISTLKEEKLLMTNKVISLEKKLLTRDSTNSIEPNKGVGMAPRESKVTTISRKSKLFHDFDATSLSPPSERSDAELPSSSFNPRLLKRNKRSLEDDFDVFINNCESKPKTYEPKKRRMFFKRGKH